MFGRVDMVQGQAMELVIVVILLALLEYLAFGAMVGRARGVYGIKAPATTGHDVFERTHRVHQNTLESLIVFVPAIWVFGLYQSPLWAAIVGALFLIGRALYAFNYIRAADKRGPGAVITGVANGVLVIGGLVGVVADLLANRV